MYFLVLFILFCVNYTGAEDGLPDKLFNEWLDEQNPSSGYPPETDKAGPPPFKYPFAFAQRSFYSGGWVRQVSARDLPIATQIAGAQMRLVKGGVRELHWHVSAEWAYMIYGRARITAVDSKGRAFVEDVKAGDMWVFPGGIPHSIQGIGNDGAFFILAFNDGNFDSTKTYMLNDWMNHVPKDVLAKNFQVSKSTFNDIPQENMYIFEAQLPQSLATEQTDVYRGTGEVPESYACFTDLLQPNVTSRGGQAKIIDANNFPVTNIASAIVTLKPGALRELHWHPKSDEWQYYVQGEARMGLMFGGGPSRTMDFAAGDVGYIPQSVPHYIENIGDCDLVFLEVFPTPYYEDISLALWLAHTPTRLVDEHIHTGIRFIESISNSEKVIVP